MKLYAIILSLVLQGSVWMTCAGASEADLQWNDAVLSVKEAQNDFAFMGFQTISDDFPKSRYALPSTLAIGEYYYSQENWPMAAEAFKNFYLKYPQRDESMIAIAYLYKIATLQHQTDKIKEYRKMAASFKQLTFVFSETKKFRFYSAFGWKYKVIYHIDKAELYVNGKLFTEIPF